MFEVHRTESISFTNSWLLPVLAVSSSLRVAFLPTPTSHLAHPLHPPSRELSKKPWLLNISYQLDSLTRTLVYINRPKMSLLGAGNLMKKAWAPIQALPLVTWTGTHHLNYLSLNLLSVKWEEDHLP